MGGRIQQSARKNPWGEFGLKRLGRKGNFPARRIGRSSSEVEFQSELNKAWQVDRVRHHSEVSAGQRPVRRSELGMVKQVEELGSELNIKPFSNGGSLEHCEIEIDDSLLPDRGVYARFVAEGPSVVGPSRCSVGPAGLSEAGRVEPFGHSGN